MIDKDAHEVEFPSGTTAVSDDLDELNVGDLLIKAEQHVADHEGQPIAQGSPDVAVSAPRPGVEHDTVVVLDFGAQYSQLIARRVRELGVYCELLPFDAPASEIARLQPRAYILSGGGASVYDHGAPTLAPYVVESGLPVLGICYGMHLLAQAHGGSVEPATHREYGPALVRRTVDSPLFAGLGDDLPVWMSHSDKVVALPAGFEVLASSPNAPVAAMGKGTTVGLQFHPEVAHTPQGKEILANFLFKLAGLSPTWSARSFIGGAVEQIREAVGEGRVLCGLSGGVDSSVAAALVHKAIGDRLTCLFVDNGLLRQGEPEDVIETFVRNLHMNLVAVDAADRFLSILEGVSDPEEKRKRIGATFIRVFEEEAEKLGSFDFLAQGTVYPDVIESATPERPQAARIKTHHNVGGLPADMRFKLIEPLRYLFKDEVRQVGIELGLSDEIVWRQPFPGPGLAVRLLGPITRERLDTLRAADAILRHELLTAGLNREVWQAFAVLLPVQSVGVMGDNRTYADVVALRAVTSVDGMTADWAKLPYELLGTMANRIVNEVKHVNRVVYDITSKPPATIEWE
ncbi:MAG: glutamine-hydrolyzing GMP synthase [Chloroflexota bacterium]|nr:glutamine-hydrolyzing GMP synthase [Chloroflexota bacterium]